MFYVFYILPRHYNLISYQQVGLRKIDPNQTLIVASQSMAKEDQKLEDFIEIDKE